MEKMGGLAVLLVLLLSLGEKEKAEIIRA